MTATDTATVSVRVEHAAREVLPCATAQEHVDGMGLNDRIHVSCDARDPEGGGASHEYRVSMGTDNGPCIVAAMQFQHGPRDVAGSTPGITEAVLLDILIDRLRGFQHGPYACRENELMLQSLEVAHHWTRERAWRRARQGVLGKNAVHAAEE